MKIMVIFILMFALIFVSGCTNNNLYIDEPEKQVVRDKCPIEDYKNGVLYFKCDEGDFVSKLSGYIAENNATVLSVTGIPATGAYNSDKGYLVVVKT